MLQGLACQTADEKGATSCPGVVLPTCGAGLYVQVGSSQTACAACPSGWYEPDDGKMTTCKSCSTGSFSKLETNSVGTITEKTSGNCLTERITSLDACTMAARKKSGKNNAQAKTTSQRGQSTQPYGCSFNPAYGVYYFNTNQWSSAKCSTNYRCICSKPTGPTSCTTCPTGYVQSIKQQSTCSECTAGSFQNMTGQATCQNCQPGRYSETSGNTYHERCLPCPRGTSSATIAATECQKCKAGKYQNQNLQRACKLCEAGKYGNRHAAKTTSCQDCPSRSPSSDPGATDMYVLL